MPYEPAGLLPRSFLLFMTDAGNGHGDDKDDNTDDTEFTELRSLDESNDRQFCEG